MDPMLRWVTVWSAALGLAVVCGSLFFQSLEITLGAFVGVALAIGNFWLLRRLGQRMLAGGRRGRAAGAVLGFKFLALVGVLYLLMRFVPMHMLALLCGVSVVMVLVVLAPVLGPVAPDDA